LGDGFLYPTSIYSANFQYVSKHHEYIKYISDNLKLFGIKQAGRTRRIINKERGNITYNYCSLSYPELLNLRKKWYPYGKKIIPKDLKLNSLICRQWYIGHGHLKHQNNNRGNPHIILSIKCFKNQNLKWITKQLNNLGFICYKRKSNNTILISANSTRDFLNYIGKCPVKCYEYKWAY